ncbi:hypothetical protein L1D14_07265 [Vibrio tubiashii]|uniref:hypothetical protein n=1 Tax=Vibrio tubiashii TaxID=29498 RepID=UPI001EFCF9F5|nr:hypothetical protein [Vibrio tubiashii]MCG9576036.1 hypothetical protein [Vibrio tubiashii]
MNIFNSNKLVFALLLSFSQLPLSYAGDSTTQVISNLSQTDTFSSAGNRKLIYNGTTTGRIGYSGYKQINVDGRIHDVGLGIVTRIKAGEAKSVTYNTCHTSGGNCTTYQTGKSVPACTIIVTDGYAQGCDTRVNYELRSCVTRSRHTYCEFHSNQVLGDVGYVNTVVGYN